MSSRGNPAVSRSQFPAGAQVPEGFYLNVAVPTTFAESEQPVRELVSFRLDEDKVWRVSGYSLRGPGDDGRSRSKWTRGPGNRPFFLTFRRVIVSAASLSHVVRGPRAFTGSGDLLAFDTVRSEGRRVGKRCVSTGR